MTPDELDTAKANLTRLIDWRKALSAEMYSMFRIAYIMPADLAARVQTALNLVEQAIDELTVAERPLTEAINTAECRTEAAHERAERPRTL